MPEEPEEQARRERVDPRLRLAGWDVVSFDSRRPQGRLPLLAEGCHVASCHISAVCFRRKVFRGRVMQRCCLHSLDLGDSEDPDLVMPS